VLTNLLPGVRHLRAPLAAGLLWLLIGWLLGHEAILSRVDDHSGAVDALVRLKDALSPVGLAAALAFVAYVIGVLWTPVPPRLAAWLRPYCLRLASIATLMATHRPLRRRDWKRIRRYAPSDEARVQTLISRKGFRALETLGAKAVMEINEVVRGTAPPEISDSWWRRNGQDVGFLAAADHVRALTDARDLLHAEAADSADFDAQFVVTTEKTARAVLDELDLVARRLISEQPEQYSEVDRLRAEGDFRLAVSLPLALALTVIATGADLSPGAMAGACAFAALVGIVLLVSGVNRLIEANDLLVDLLSAGLVHAPVLEQLRERAGIVTGSVTER
jgi:hypothetical protein